MDFQAARSVYSSGKKVSGPALPDRKENAVTAPHHPKTIAALVPNILFHAVDPGFDIRLVDFTQAAQQPKAFPGPRR
jgi:hypothetical protein